MPLPSEVVVVLDDEEENDVFVIVKVVQDAVGILVTFDDVLTCWTIVASAVS